MLQLIVKFVVITSGTLKLIAYWVAVAYYLIAQNQVKDAQTVIAGIIGTIIFVMLTYYLFYWMLFCNQVPSSETNASCSCVSTCLMITCKRSLPLMIFSSLGVMQLMVALKLYRFLLCQGDDPSLCRKVAFGIISGLGSMTVMATLIGNAIGNTSAEAEAYYKVTQIFGYIAIGFTVLGQAVNQSANNFNLCNRSQVNPAPNVQTSITNLQR